MVHSCGRACFRVLNKFAYMNLLHILYKIYHSTGGPQQCWRSDCWPGQRLVDESSSFIRCSRLADSEAYVKTLAKTLGLLTPDASPGSIRNGLSRSLTRSRSFEVDKENIAAPVAFEVELEA